MAVCLKETGELIGDCGLIMQNIGGVIKPEIGYHICKDMQRKGFAKEAASSVRDWTLLIHLLKKSIPIRNTQMNLLRDPLSLGVVSRLMNSKTK